MKLSEILKDWPERNGCIGNPYGKSNKSLPVPIDPYLRVFNEGIDLCDREIDREALLKALNDYVYSSRPCEEGCDKFISAMPTWLKLTENGRIRNDYRINASPRKDDWGIS